MIILITEVLEKQLRIEINDSNEWCFDDSMSSFSNSCSSWLRQLNWWHGVIETSLIAITNFYPQFAQASRKCNGIRICIVQYMPLTRLKKPARFMDVYETYKCWDPQSLDLPFGPSPWTSLWTQSMGYPCGPPLIFEDKFYQRSKWIFKHLKWLLSYELLLLYHCSNFLKFRTWVGFGLVKEW